MPLLVSSEPAAYRAAAAFWARHPEKKCHSGSSGIDRVAVVWLGLFPERTTFDAGVGRGFPGGEELDSSNAKP